MSNLLIFVGLGTDEAAVIKILAHRNGAQRKLIREAYAAVNGEDLLKDLEKELSGDFLVSLPITSSSFDLRK